MTMAAYLKRAMVKKVEMNETKTMRMTRMMRYVNDHFTISANVKLINQ